METTKIKMSKKITSTHTIYVEHGLIAHNPRWLKGLRHAILGNFSTDQIVIELLT